MASKDGQRVWVRIVATLGLTAMAATFLALDALRQAGAGSFTAYLLVTPLLAALIASGIRPSPGVGDTEFDWILAIFFASGGLLTIELLSRRLPTLAGLWHWDHYVPLVWAMAAGMVLFSARHVLRLWRAWAFTLCCVPVMPFLLLTSQLGGTEDDAIAAAATLGTVAVYLATSTFARHWRLTAALINLAVALGLDLLMDLPDVLSRIAVAAGVVPVMSVISVRRAAHTRIAASIAAHPARGVTRFPRVGARSYAVLLLLAVSMLLFSPPPVSAVRGPVAVPADWVSRLGLQRSAEFSFISGFLGPGAELTRYVLPAPTAHPAVAIDVITAPNSARLDDYADAVWYPSATPVNYRPAGGGGPGGIDVRSAHSDPDAIGAGASGQWFALTWTWLAGEEHQRVTVVVNQDVAAAAAPAPQPVGWTNSLLEPMLWLTRQQPAPTGIVPNRVARTADDVARTILAVGGGR
ncbi:hypothetical protein MCEMIE22_00513 [Mycobacteriaceae bacterium]